MDFCRINNTNNMSSGNNRSIVVFVRSSACETIITSCTRSEGVFLCCCACNLRTVHAPLIGGRFGSDTSQFNRASSQTSILTANCSWLNRVGRSSLTLNNDSTKLDVTVITFHLDGCFSINSITCLNGVCERVGSACREITGYSNTVQGNTFTFFVACSTSSSNRDNVTFCKCTVVC